MTKIMWRSVGLPLKGWELLDELKRDPYCLNFGYIAEADVLTWALRMARAHVMELHAADKVKADADYAASSSTLSTGEVTQ